MRLSRLSAGRDPAAPPPVRIGPVHFQPLEQELEPVLQYLSGRLLDAGCGTRDISRFLGEHGIADITRYDLQPGSDDVVAGPLESLPFADAAFDAVLCNAVLEHVDDAERSARELARVVKPGGHVVVAVPFLQPYHPCPGDFQRYTSDGLAQLGRRTGLEVVIVLPVHSFAQTLGWMVWAYALEKGGWLRRGLAWAIAFLITRRHHATDTALRNNANTFQAVYRRPVAGERPALGDWRATPVPAACAGVPTMLVPDELRLLHHLGDQYYSGLGSIVEAGAFLGGSTVALAAGLRQNLARRGYSAQRLIHSYDRFEVEEWMLGRYFPKGTPAGASFRASYDQNVAPYADLVEVHAGDIEDHPWAGGPIEILFIDVAKHWTICDWITAQFFPHLIAGRSIVVQQDYLYHHWVAWLHITMEFYSEYFEYLCDTGVNSVAFRCIKAIPASALRPDTVASLSTEEKVALMDRAVDRFQGAQRDLLLSAKRQFLDLLGEE